VIFFPPFPALPAFGANPMPDNNLTMPNRNKYNWDRRKNFK